MSESIHAKHDDWWCECGLRVDDCVRLQEQLATLEPNLRVSSNFLERIAEELNAHGLGPHVAPSECQAGAVLGEVRRTLGTE